MSLAGLLAGCGQGYPEHDAAPESPFEMSQSQRLDALNLLGKQVDDKLRWRYAMDSGCVLEVRQRGSWTGGATTEVRLDEVSVETRSRVDGEGHGVQLVSAGRSGEAVTLMRSDGLRPAQQASLLVKLLKRDCTS